MKIPFFKKRKKRRYFIEASADSLEPLKEGVVVKGVKASTFFVEASDDEMNQVFDEVLDEVNKEQKEVVEEYGNVAA